MKAINCLLITTSDNWLGDTLNKTGVWLEDLAAPYYLFKDAGEYGDQKRERTSPQLLHHENGR
jgi:hypothetical protein